MGVPWGATAGRYSLGPPNRRVCLSGTIYHRSRNDYFQFYKKKMTMCKSIFFLFLVFVTTSCTSTIKLKQQIKTLETENTALKKVNLNLQKELDELRENQLKPGEGRSNTGVETQNSTKDETPVTLPQKRTKLAFEQTVINLGTIRKS